MEATDFLRYIDYGYFKKNDTPVVLICGDSIPIKTAFLRYVRNRIAGLKAIHFTYEQFMKQRLNVFAQDNLIVTIDDISVTDILTTMLALNEKFGTQFVTTTHINSWEIPVSLRDQILFIKI